MNQRQAKRIAHGFAFVAVQQMLDVGSAFDLKLPEEDQLRVNRALDELAQQHFDLADEKFVNVTLPTMQQEAANEAPYPDHRPGGDRE